MSAFTDLPPAEIERRRAASVEAIKARDRQAWAEKYQETCDRMYWTRGQCCAGCDHWGSDMGLSGTCAAAGIMSGDDVMRSIGVEFSSYQAPPGLPFTTADFHCGKFSDAFDWSSLDGEYLDRIGARQGGVLRAKPERGTA